MSDVGYNITFFFFTLIVLIMVSYLIIGSIVRLIYNYSRASPPTEKEKTPNDEYEYPDFKVEKEERNVNTIMGGLERMHKQYQNELESSPVIQEKERRGIERQPSQIHPGVFSDEYDNNTYNRKSERSFWSLLFMP